FDDANDIEHFDPNLKGKPSDNYFNWYKVKHLPNQRKTNNWLQPILMPFEIDFEDRINKIKLIDDVKVKLTNLTSEKEVDIFLDMFSLKGRYEFHNTISLEMIEKRKKYSDSQIDEIVKIFRKNKILIDKEAFKKDIFGLMIFEKENNNEPFEKYKKILQNN
ncbi:MAG: hypothetical protein HC854_12400, partial [Flavobacterium sp.]|nr:hypothetical protein [Flavobacterium sp.]